MRGRDSYSSTSSCQRGNSTRKILINQPQTEKFPSNEIQTAKYTIYNFLPFALIQQFRNYFNIFYLCCIIVYSIKKISPIEPSTAYSPFSAVLLISLIREGIENVRKAKEDKIYNNYESYVYNSNKQTFDTTRWKNINVGNIIRVEKGCEIPADILIIKSSNENGFCYLQTSNLDGETNLKPREAIKNFHSIIKKEKDIDSKINGIITIDTPNKNIYNINGYISKNDNDNIFFDNNNCLLRGGFLKKVDYVYGIVIYTGKETKIMLNIKKGNQKLSSLDILLNKIVISIVSISLILSIIMSSIGITKAYANRPDYKNNNMKMFYIYYKPESDNKLLDSVKTAISFCQIFFTLIPVSVIIALEVTKGLQTLLLSYDDGYSIGDEKKHFFSMKLHENLGLVKFVFTDKTGTLTKNEMEFKGCSIFTKKYSKYEGESTVIDTNEGSYEKQKSVFSKEFNVLLLKESLKKTEKLEIIDENSECEFSTLKEITTQFFVNIALNHNVLINEEENSNKNSSNKSSYSGSNPDEVILVQAAKELGIEFIGRIGDDCTVKIDGFDEHYTILNRFDFTSARKRSSIIVRDKEDNIIMYMKGADSVILKKLNKFSREKLLPKTTHDVDSFSKEGLRTLCYSMKFLSEEEYRYFKEEYAVLKEKSLKDKKQIKALEDLIDDMEDNMLLLGVSALEDMLQDNVKSTIKDLIEAEINVWMLTGDKLDTAESIGYSCKLLNNDTEVFKIKENDRNNIKDVLTKIDEKMKNFLVNDPNKYKEMEIKQSLDNSLENENLYLKSNHRNLLFKERKRSNSIELENLVNHNNGKSKYLRSKGMIHFKNENDKEENENKNHNLLSLSQIQYQFKPKKDPVQKIDLNGNLIHQESTQNREIELSNAGYEGVNTLPLDSNQNLKIQSIAKNKDIQTIDYKEVNNIPDNIHKESYNTISQNENKKQNYPNEDSIFKYMINQNFFNDSSNKDLSLSFFNKDKKQKNENCNLRKIKTQYQQKLKGLLSEKENDKDDDKENNIQFRNFAIIIEGEALDKCMNRENHALFYKCLEKCRSVICARCAPFQKSKIVEFIKKKSKQMTLAIGDGGNDVNMILSAHIGVGIFGKEGSQAAYSADYSFSQFQYLKKLIFVFGRYSLYRNVYYVKIFFFKSTIYVFTIVYFSFYSFISGTILFDDLYAMGYNLFLSVIPPCLFAIFEEDLDMTFLKNKNKEMTKILIPDLYKEQRDKNLISIFKVILSFVSGMLVALPTLFVPLMSYKFSLIDDIGRPGTLPDVSFVSVWGVIIIPYLILLYDTSIFNIWNFCFHLLQFFILLAFPFAQNSLDGFLLSEQLFDITWNFKFFFVFIMTCAISFIVFLLVRTVEWYFTNNLVMRVKMDKIDNDIMRKTYIKKLIETTRYERCIHKFREMYLLKNSGDVEAENYAGKKMKTLVAEFKKLHKKNETLNDHGKSLNNNNNINNNRKISNNI